MYFLYYVSRFFLTYLLAKAKTDVSNISLEMYELFRTIAKVINDVSELNTAAEKTSKKNNFIFIYLSIYTFHFKPHRRRDIVQINNINECFTSISRLSIVLSDGVDCYPDRSPFLYILIALL